MSISVSETFDQDKQCRAYRSGILCGACKSPYSLAISSTECVNCNNYSNLLITLTWLGVILIPAAALLFMFGCNFTITDGTLSGFLFYVSMFHLSENIFLRGFSDRLIKYADLLAWLNFEIGLSTCFYNEFNAFGQVILRFIIPCVAWTVLGLLIFISSKSSRVTRLIGNNSVKILATIIMVSYTTIIQTEVTVFSCSTISYPTLLPNDTIVKHHWQADGNVLCWQGKHWVLVVIGVLFGVATVLYTLTLLFIQPLQRYSHVRGLRWVAKLKPFFDAYTSPHIIKPRYQFWNGLLLLCRMLSTILFAFQSEDNKHKHYAITLTIICIVVLFLFGYFGGVYQQKWLNILNVSYYANITLLTFLSFFILTEYKESNERGYKHQNNATYISLSFAFATFLLIITYHVYKRLKDTGLLARCVIRVKNTGCWRVVVGWCNRSRTV